MPAGDSVVLMGVGDVGPVHGDMAGYATHVASTFATADVVFAQCERLYSAGARLEGDGYDGNFDVGGYLQLQTNPASPEPTDCNEAAEQGRAVVEADSGTTQLFVCVETAVADTYEWRSTDLT